MATFEEADPRWKVKDLGTQGANVNNWYFLPSTKLAASPAPHAHSTHANPVRLASAAVAAPCASCRGHPVEQKEEGYTYRQGIRAGAGYARLAWCATAG
jgi:hypothetical protein